MTIAEASDRVILDGLETYLYSHIVLLKTIASSRAWLRSRMASSTTCASQTGSSHKSPDTHPARRTAA